MKWFERRTKAEPPAAPVVQVRQGESHPFAMMEGYTPLQSGQVQLYRSIREAVPIVDAAIWKLVRLCGGVEIKSRDPAAQEELERFWKGVDTGWGQRGVQAFLGGVRPCAVGLIFSAAITLCLGTLLGWQGLGTVPAPDVRGLVILAVLVPAGIIGKKLLHKKMSPILLILLSAVLGMLIYQ